MNILWDKLEDLRPTPICSCAVTRTCALSSSVRNFKNMKYIICFLKGLNGNYVNVHTHILLTDLLPSLSKVYSLVSQQNPLHSEKSIESTILVVNTKNFKYPYYPSKGLDRGSKIPLICTHFNKTNHPMDHCYFKHGITPIIDPKPIQKTLKQINLIMLIQETSTPHPITTLILIIQMTQIFPYPKKTTNTW